MSDLEKMQELFDKAGYVREANFLLIEYNKKSYSVDGLVQGKKLYHTLSLCSENSTLVFKFDKAGTLINHEFE